MTIFRTAALALGLSIIATPVFADELDTIRDPRKLTDEQARVAEANYMKYCVLCHGENREGYVNDHAPSLRSKQLFQSGVPHEVLRALSYGREGTAMGGYIDEIGGPLTNDETWDLTYWLYWESGAKRVRINKDPVYGDIDRGRDVYAENCTACHGVDGEGVNAPALNNRSALMHNSDEFIRFAITYGRDDTPMQAFKDVLSEEDIDNVTAFLRSKASNWTEQKPVLKAMPGPDDYIINPEGEDPDFELRDGLYVSSDDLFKAMEDKKKMVLLDTRVTSVWQRVHLEGSIPIPYYSNFDRIAQYLPKDTQIVGYCSCPRAAADSVIKKLRARGYERTAVLYEGIFGWMNLGYPVMRGDIRDEEAEEQ